MKLRIALIAIMLLLVSVAAEAARGRVSAPTPVELDRELPIHPLGGFFVENLLRGAGLEEPFTMTAIDWRLRATVRSDNAHRFNDSSWLAAQNMTSGLATIQVWRERNGKYCNTQTLTLPIGREQSVIVPMNSMFYERGDIIWFEYWPAYTLHIEGATSFGVWSSFGSITQSPSSSKPHLWWQIVEPSQVSCD